MYINIYTYIFIQAPPSLYRNIFLRQTYKQVFIHMNRYLYMRFLVYVYMLYMYMYICSTYIYIYIYTYLHRSIQGFIGTFFFIKYENKCYSKGSFISERYIYIYIYIHLCAYICIYTYMYLNISV
jgi:hypothetical protein